MRIAVIGWGSLIWFPGSLQIKSKWRRDGPTLPIEFARISSDGRLTLVIHPGSLQVRTYWAISAFDTLEEAREDLAVREGTVLSGVDEARVSESDTTGKSNALTTVLSWLKTQQNLEGAIWTSLGSNWESVRGQPFGPDDAVRYLSELERERDRGALRYDRACEYVRNAPDQIQTDVRKLLHEKEPFKSLALPETLFE